MKRQSGFLVAGLLVAATTFATLGLSQPVLAQDKVTLRMSTWLPAGHHLSISLNEWAAQIAEASDGSLTIAFDSAALAKPPGQYDVVRDGIADLAYPVLGYTPGRFTIMRGTELPFLSPSAEVGSQAAW
ncbi:MAG: TRAP transporter substrate-binding protein, partial [Alphaproteobacteria bacterium]